MMLELQSPHSSVAAAVVVPERVVAKAVQVLLDLLVVQAVVLFAPYM